MTTFHLITALSLTALNALTATSAAAAAVPAVTSLAPPRSQPAGWSGALAAARTRADASTYSGSSGNGSPGGYGDYGYHNYGGYGPATATPPPPSCHVTLPGCSAERARFGTDWQGAARCRHASNWTTTQALVDTADQLYDAIDATACCASYAQRATLDAASAPDRRPTRPPRTGHLTRLCAARRPCAPTLPAVFDSDHGPGSCVAVDCVTPLLTARQRVRATLAVSAVAGSCSVRAERRQRTWRPPTRRRRSRRLWRRRRSGRPWWRRRRARAGHEPESRGRQRSGGVGCHARRRARGRRRLGAWPRHGRGLG